MALKKKCYYCGHYYYRDKSECPECGAQNEEAIASQKKKKSRPVGTPRDDRWPNK